MSSEIYSVYDDQIGSLQDEALSQYEGNTGQGQRQWRIPTGWASSPFDIQAISDLFDRSEMNEDYSTNLTGDGSVGDNIAIKLQADHLAGQERAFRSRYASTIRCGIHAANRRNGHSMENGGVFARVTDHISDVITSGA